MDTGAAGAIHVCHWCVAIPTAEPVVPMSDRGFAHHFLTVNIRQPHPTLSWGVSFSHKELEILSLIQQSLHVEPKQS